VFIQKNVMLNCGLNIELIFQMNIPVLGRPFRDLSLKQSMWIEDFFRVLLLHPRTHLGKQNSSAFAF
jgi:hypothetical protein